MSYTTTHDIWMVSEPYVIDIEVGPEHQDDYQHTNNVAYLQWLEKAAWAHSCHLGLDMAAYYRLGVGCVVKKHELNYMAPTYTGDQLQVGTWISANDGKLSTTREYQIVRVQDGKTVLTGLTQFVTVDMTSGKPKRMPKEFVEAYLPAQ